MPELRATGHCLCGAVSFEAIVRKPETHICHCEFCRRWTGSSLLAVSIQPEDIRFDGEEHIRTFASSDWARRAWCERCGSTLYYRLSVDDYGPRTFEMALGLFDDPDALPVTQEIFIDRKPRVYDFVGDHPRLTEQEMMAERGLG